MTVLITSDLHLTTSPHDEHRWGLFDWLCDNSKDVDELLLLGDLTNPKDNHPGILVNRLKESIDKLADHFRFVYMLYGNHDGLTPDQPFWKFLHNIKPNVYFVHQPSYVELSIGKALLVPAGTDWGTLTQVKGISWIFTHATFEGAISETGFRLSGVSLEHVERLGLPIISGDIHKPQIIGELVEYVGAPYHIRFGDQYKPRVMHINDQGARSDLYYPAPLKRVYDITSLSDLDDLPIDHNQYAKIRVHLDRGELTDWPLIQDAIRQLSENAGWKEVRAELVIKQGDQKIGRTESDRKSPEELVEEYVKRHNGNDQHIETGKSLL